MIQPAWTTIRVVEVVMAGRRQRQSDVWRNFTQNVANRLKCNVCACDYRRGWKWQQHALTCVCAALCSTVGRLWHCRYRKRGKIGLMKRSANCTDFNKTNSHPFSQTLQFLLFSKHRERWWSCASTSDFSLSFWTMRFCSLYYKVKQFCRKEKCFLNH